jgi:hypothetical protein
MPKRASKKMSKKTSKQHVKRHSKKMKGGASYRYTVTFASAMTGKREVFDAKPVQIDFIEKTIKFFTEHPKAPLYVYKSGDCIVYVADKTHMTNAPQNIMFTFYNDRNEPAFAGRMLMEEDLPSPRGKPL